MKEWLQISRQFFQLIVNDHKTRCIFRGDLPELRFCPIPIGPPRNHVSIREGNLNRGIAGDHPQAVIGEMQLCDHLGPQHARNIRSARNPAAGRDFFGHATSANNLASLQHQHGQPAARQIRSRSQPVVAATDHDCVVDGVGTLLC